MFFLMFIDNDVTLIMQFSKLSSEVRGGRGKVPVADYKVAKHFKVNDVNASTDLGINRSCYSFCMCPGGQVNINLQVISEILPLFLQMKLHLVK